MDMVIGYIENTKVEVLGVNVEVEYAGGIK